MHSYFSPKVIVLANSLLPDESNYLQYKVMTMLQTKLHETLTAACLA